MSTKLQINNLPCTMDDLELRQMFEEYGRVRNARIITRDDARQCSGTGIVEMSSKEETLLAMLALDGTECMGQTLNVRQVQHVGFDQDQSPDRTGPRPGGFGDRSGQRSSWGAQC